MEGEHAAREDVGAETETAGHKMGKWEEVKEVRFIMQWRVKIRKEGREAPVDSKDRKPQLHSHVHSLIHTRTHTHSCWRYNPACPWIETVQLRCTTPLLHCVVVPVLFSPGVSDSDNTIVCSGLAEHCGHLILALAETIEYCPSERGRRKRLVGESGLFRSLSLSSRCVRGKQTVLILFLFNPCSISFLGMGNSFIYVCFRCTYAIINCKHTKAY